MSPIECPRCGSDYIVKTGKRKTKMGKRQLYHCNSCGRKFVDEGLEGKTYPPQVIIEALKLYSSGKTLSQTSKKVNQRFKVNTSKSTIHNWIQEYREKGLLGYLKRKKKHEKKYGKDLIRKIKFQHSDLEYLFKFHRAKLGEAGSRFSQLVDFLQNMEDNCPEELFNPEKEDNHNSEDEKQLRSSQLEPSVDLKDLDLYQTRNKACELAEFALKENKDRNKRHEEIQDFMLKCDNATFSVEVPIWYYDKRREVTITGHIDFLQERAGKIFILDYKPKAEKINPVPQLFSYARGLSFRTGVPLRKIKTAWFNKNIYREFEPLRIYKRIEKGGPKIDN